MGIVDISPAREKLRYVWINAFLSEQLKLYHKLSWITWELLEANLFVSRNDEHLHKSWESSLKDDKWIILAPHFRWMCMFKKLHISDSSLILFLLFKDKQWFCRFLFFIFLYIRRTMLWVQKDLTLESKEFEIES